MKQNFRSALNFVLLHECVFEHGHYGDFAHVISENVPGDAGGLTKFGIDQRSHPNINIKSLDYAGASYLYQEDWDRCCCSDLPGGYDVAILDIATLNGDHFKSGSQGEAVLLLQRALNLAGAQPPLKEDAWIGPKTIAAAQHGGSNGLEHLLTLREKLLRDIVVAHPIDKEFLPGWLDRNQDLAAEVASYLAPEKAEAMA